MGPEPKVATATLLTRCAIRRCVNREISLPKVQVSKSTALVLLGLGIYLTYLRHLGLGEVAKSLDHVNLTLFSVALVFSLMMVAFNALSWRRVAEELDFCPSFRDLVLIYLASIFMNNLLPSGGFSGETARIYFLGKVEGSSRFDASFASVAASRIITAVPFILGMVLGLAYLIFRYQVPGWALTTCFAMTALAVSAGFAFVGICFEERWLQRMVGVVIRPLERIFHRELDREVCSGAVSGFSTKMLHLRHNNRALLESLAWAFAGWLCLEAVAFASFRSLGVEVSPLAIFAVYSVIVVFQTLPLGLPGGIGLVEILMTGLFSAVGVSIYDAAAVTILIRLVQLWFLALLGGLSTVHLMRRIERDKKGPEAMGLSGIRI
jgi:uncharacterized protein (TIRG00374 family)